MKKLFLLFAAALMTASVMAQVYPTKFLGIPIDGTKQEMIRKLQNKGYVYHQDGDYLTGEFNGTSVNIHIGTNNNKVYRIMVADQDTRSEAQIRIRFNNLMQQFKDNSKYITGKIDQDFIPADEDISYQMSVRNKVYTASFLQITHDADTTQIQQDAIEIASTILSNYSQEDFSENAEAISMIAFFKAIQKQYEKNNVWFTISEYRGKYYLVIYYDNNYNQANGEDL